MNLRILVTGSRLWTARNVIADALTKAIGDYGQHLIHDDPVLGPRLDWEAVTLVHGDARGADRIAADIGRTWRLQLEPHPADWDRYGRAAGHRRNAEMVTLGADVLLAFPIGRSPGTRGCVALAEKAGIPIHVYEGSIT